MKIGVLVGGMVVGIFSLTSGCGQAGKRVGSLSRIGLGLNARQFQGSYQGLKISTVVPVAEIWVKRELTNHFDLYGRTQFACGTLSAENGILEGRTSGNFASVGLGFNYFPLATRFFGFDAGVEAFWAKHEMRGRLGPLEQSAPDRFAGHGFHLGVLGEVPLFRSENTSLVWGAGYSFTETNARRAHADLDGWYATVGIEIKLDN